MTAFNRRDVNFHLGMQRNFRDVLVCHCVELPDPLPGEQDRSVEEAMKKIIAIIRRAGSSERDSVV